MGAHPGYAGINPRLPRRPAVPPGQSLLDGEDPDSNDPRDARHWIGVYRELVEFNERLVGRVLRELAPSPPEGRADIADDLSLMTDHLDLYRGRHAFWYQRHLDLESLTVDQQALVVTHRDRRLELTPREFQLLTALLAQPDRVFTARQLLVEAWGAPELSTEELRIYVARLRRKLSEIDLGTIVTHPGRGYRMDYRSG
jgi:hypothetical protein